LSASSGDVESTLGDYFEPDPTEERRLLVDFFRALEASGLAIPGDGEHLRSHVRQIENLEPVHSGLWPLAALAQHHGLPTRMLDWTKRAKVAAYFAAVQANTSMELEIWALFIGDRYGDGLCFGSSVLLAEVPRASNRNLHAQGGLFTVWKSYTGLKSLDEMPATGGSGDFPTMYRFVLPTTQRLDLLRWLSFDDINASNLFPGYDGVAKEVREQRLRERARGTPAS
jgi:hypothetical protein